jgi:nucleotide-binding universal stress UspA family protein
MAKRVILHATDFSPASRPAFARAIEPPTYARLQQASRAWTLKQLARLTSRAQAAGAQATAILLEGPEAGTIAGLARSRRAWLIVMGTHGRTGIERVLLGSVAARVVSLASCPVMTVCAR